MIRLRWLCNYVRIEDGSNDEMAWSRLLEDGKGNLVWTVRSRQTSLDIEVLSICEIILEIGIRAAIGRAFRLVSRGL